MRLDSLFYRFTYRFGKPRWDTSRHRPELEEFVRGRPPGRALDLGCGTGADAVLPRPPGWDVVGIDFVPEATEPAGRGRALTGRGPFRHRRRRATACRSASTGPFDLILDIGCYHAIPDRLRDEYAAEVAAAARPGADFYLAGTEHPPASWRLLGANGVDAAELRRRFGRDVRPRGGTLRRLDRADATVSTGSTSSACPPVATRPRRRVCPQLARPSRLRSRTPRHAPSELCPRDAASCAKKADSGEGACFAGLVTALSSRGEDAMSLTPLERAVLDFEREWWKAD